MVFTPGKPYPLGATVDENGVNFAIFSAHATRVELCLFDEQGQEELIRLSLPTYTHQVWHGHLSRAKAGTVYGYRVYGPFAPEEGHRFNHHKLLIDPYAKQLIGEFIHHDSHYAYDLLSLDADLSFDTQDNACYIPKCKVIDEGELLNPLTVPKPDIPMSSSIIYEMHLKGFTASCEQIDSNLRGTFKGLSEPYVLDYLTDLGVTSIELLPVHAFVTESFLDEKNLTNYWGYNSIAFFAPHPGYLTNNDVFEFKQMVDAFHKAGIEVLLDVVFNHTAEGNRLGPTYSFRGIDNASYYRLENNAKRHYINETGCGNTLNLSHPRVIQLVMDSLRHWVCVMGVDGFRFDLASTLGREDNGFDIGAGFFDALAQDPQLAGIKLIAEPWDIGPGGYRLGQFPLTWSEWNDRYRDTMRRFWRGDKDILPEFARRFHGSADIFEAGGRAPSGSVNLITSHDGYTLKDLVSYVGRHNFANLENNQDGHSHNYSDNYGVEGESDDPSVRAVRLRQAKNLLATLFLSQGVPMLLAGDEIGHSQQGNNNAYCQDNALSWRDWSEVNGDNELLNFTKDLIKLRKAYPFLCPHKYIHKSVCSDAPKGLSWYSRTGEPMTQSLWHGKETSSLVVAIKGAHASSMVDEGYKVTKERPQNIHVLLIMFNADEQPLEFNLPETPHHAEWQCLLHTQNTAPIPSINQSYQLIERSFILLGAKVDDYQR